jgi:hypothetical protein
LLLGAYRGHEEVKRFFEDDWFNAFPFEEWEVELDREKALEAAGLRE